jgi:hypothetical protein
MIISANQPYFFPFPGFFYKAHHSDVLVILDEVQLPHRTTWISRNRFKNDQGALWLTIPVWKKGLGLQHISQARICYEGRWPRKYLDSLKIAYQHAPFLGDHLGFLEEMFASRFDRLIDLNLAVIRYLRQYLQVDTKMVLLSELGVTARATQLLIEICRALGGSAFLALNQAKKYLDADLFRENGLELSFLRYQAPVYPQLWGDFLANLSTWDLVCNCGPKGWDTLMQQQPGLKYSFS